MAAVDELKIVISAEDNASGTLSKVAEGVSALNGAQAGLGRTFGENEKQGSALGRALGGLEKGMKGILNAGQKAGLTGNEILKKAVLLKDGLIGIKNSLTANDINGIISNFGRIGSGMGMTAEQISSMARSLGLIPETKRIEITAEGDVSVVDEVKETIDGINEQGGDVELKINAGGDIDVVKTTSEQLKSLSENGQVDIRFNVDTGGFDINDLDGNKLGEITAEGKINWTTGETPDTVPDASGNANFELGASPTTVPNTSGKADYTMGNHPTTAPTIYGEAVYTIKMVTGSSPGFTGKNAPWSHQATGTQYFHGGLAMVNDQRGISDPRELIIDRGRAFIPEGRDVILPLSKGAKVYTAAQTKAIMNRLGIPRYASGKDNSDAFIAARDRLNHQLKTRSFTTAEELEKWVALLNTAASTEKDIWECEEKIYSLKKKQNEELNKQSLAYINERSALNDWEDFGDSAVEAFGRIKDRNRRELDEGRLTWEEYSENVKTAGEKLYDSRQAQSYKWLEHETKYNKMSAEDYMAHLQDMAQWTRDFYAEGIIDKQKFIEEATEIDEKYLDKAKAVSKDALSDRKTAAEAYISERSALNDWENEGDDPFAAYQRVNDWIWDYKQEQTTSLEEAKEADKWLSEFGESLYDKKEKQSLDWLSEQRKYFDMSDEEYAKGLYRIKNYTQEFFNAGLITRQKYNEIMTDMNRKLWDEAKNAYDTMLEDQSDNISKLKEQFSKEEQALSDSYKVSDRHEDMAKLQNKLKIFEGAVTDKGIEKYNDYKKQLEKLRREEELYELQVRNNDAIEKLTEEYNGYKDKESEFLKSIAENTDIDISYAISKMESGKIGDIAKSIDMSVSGIVSSANSMGNSIIKEIGGYFNRLINTVNDKDFVGPVQNFNDSRNINVSANSWSELVPFLAGLQK